MPYKHVLIVKMCYPYKVDLRNAFNFANRITLLTQGELESQIFQNTSLLACARVTLRKNNF